MIGISIFIKSFGVEMWLTPLMKKTRTLTPSMVRFITSALKSQMPALSTSIIPTGKKRAIGDQV
jgi:hypothetical protein